MHFSRAVILYAASAAASPLLGINLGTPATSSTSTGSTGISKDGNLGVTIGGQDFGISLGGLTGSSSSSSTSGTTKTTTPSTTSTTTSTNPLTGGTVTTPTTPSTPAVVPSTPAVVPSTPAVVPSTGTTTTGSTVKTPATPSTPAVVPSTPAVVPSTPAVVPSTPAVVPSTGTTTTGSTVKTPATPSTPAVPATPATPATTPSTGTTTGTSTGTTTTSKNPTAQDATDIIADLNAFDATVQNAIAAVKAFTGGSTIDAQFKAVGTAGDAWQSSILKLIADAQKLNGLGQWDATYSKAVVSTIAGGLTTHLGDLYKGITDKKAFFAQKGAVANVHDGLWGIREEIKSICEILVPHLQAADYPALQTAGNSIYLAADAAIKAFAS